MIKKISLYGLCFNLGIAFATPPTRENVEAFIAKLSDRAEVKRTLFGNPYEIICDNDDLIFAINKSHIFDAITDLVPEEDSGVSEEVQKIEVLSEEYEVEQAEASDAADVPASLTDIPQNRTPEERRASFLKYSREANAEELALVDGWDVKGLRIVDFDSIVNGLDDEAQKLEAQHLIKNETILLKAIDQWADTCRIDNIRWLKVTIRNFVPPEEALLHSDCFPYLLEPKTISDARELLKATLKDMLRYKSAREVLALSLVLLKNEEVNINGLSATVHKNANIAWLYYQLTERLSSLLGIYEHFSILGDLGSTLERDLFRLGKLPESAASIRIPSALINALFEKIYCPEELTLTDVPQQKFFRVMQMSLLWSRIENIWNHIGFANVDDVIYVNRMSEMNLLKVPFLFYPKTCLFTNFGRSLGLMFEMAPSIVSFLNSVKLAVTKDISSLCPTLEAWKVWLKLQCRTDASAVCISSIDKSKDELVNILGSMELLDGK